MHSDALVVTSRASLHTNVNVQSTSDRTGIKGPCVYEHHDRGTTPSACAFALDDAMYFRTFKTVAFASVLITSVAAVVAPTDPSYPSSVLAIRDTLNHYPLAIDSKVLVTNLSAFISHFIVILVPQNFAALSGVFTEDAVANYSAPLGVLTGLPSIESTISKDLAPVNTQHSLTTQVITLLTESIANTTSYYVAQHFGQGIYYGELYTAYGRYDDQLVSTSDGWRISHRQLTYMVSLPFTKRVILKAHFQSQGPGSGNVLIFANLPSS